VFPRIGFGIMSKHRLHYIDMRPQPLKREPTQESLAVWLAAAFTMAAIYLLTVILFSF
jgi:hypothetical protein